MCVCVCVCVYIYVYINPNDLCLIFLIQSSDNEAAAGGFVMTRNTGQPIRTELIYTYLC